MIDNQTIAVISDTDPNDQDNQQRKLLEKLFKESRQKSNIDNTSDNHKSRKRFPPDNKKYQNTIEIIAAALFVIAAYAASWLATCLIVGAVSWCFDFAFSWKIGTGVWLTSLLLRSITGSGKN